MAAPSRWFSRVPRHPFGRSEDPPADNDYRPAVIFSTSDSVENAWKTRENKGFSNAPGDLTGYSSAARPARYGRKTAKIGLFSWILAVCGVWITFATDVARRGS